MKSELFNDDCDYSHILNVLEQETKEEIEKKKTFLSTYKEASTKALIREFFTRKSASGNDLILGFEYMQKNIDKMQTEFDELQGLLLKIQSWEESSDETIESRIRNALRNSEVAYYGEHKGRIDFGDGNIKPPLFMPKPEDLI